MPNKNNDAKSYSDDWDEPPSQSSAASSRTEAIDVEAREFPAKRQAAKEVQKAPMLDESDEASIEALGPIAHSARPDFFPSLTARSSLFCASRIGIYNSDDTKTETMELKCQGASLTYNGPRLDMHDKLVWETAVQIAKDRKAPVGTTFTISLRDFASRMGWKNPSGTNLKWIWTSIKRLSRAHLEYKATPKDAGPGEEQRHLPTVEGVGTLIAGAQRRGDSYAIQICEQFSKFAFELDKQFLIQIKRRETLKNLLAKWLHDFLSTHTKEQEFDISYLRGLSGFTGRQKDFPGKLTAALDELKGFVPGLVAGYEMVKVGKSSDEWKIVVKRGDEKPQFIMPRLASNRIENSDSTGDSASDSTSGSTKGSNSDTKSNSKRKPKTQSRKRSGVAL